MLPNQAQHWQGEQRTWGIQSGSHYELPTRHGTGKGTSAPGV